LPNVGYVVVKLVNINNSGLLDAEQARPMVENTIRNEKKAQLIIKKMAGSSLADIAKKNKVEVSKAAAISLSSPLLPNSGFEPKVVGAAFGLSPKKVSKPIEGTTGVYVVSTETLTKAPAAKDYTAQITNLKSQANQGSGSIFTSLKDKAKIEDNRVELGL
jgi:peptidyl-prolyl cis-trans isomerase D